MPHENDSHFHPQGSVFLHCCTARESFALGEAERPSPQERGNAERLQRGAKRRAPAERRRRES